MGNNEKRIYRETKRAKKRAGNRERRNYLKRQLRDNPEEAHWDDFVLGDNSTEFMNGIFRDSTRHYNEYDDIGYLDEEQDRY